MYYRDAVFVLYLSPGTIQFGVITSFCVLSYHRWVDIVKLSSNIARESHNPRHPLWKLDIYGDYVFGVLALFPRRLSVIPYPEPVYTGLSSVHWNATGMPLVDPVYNGIHWATERILAGYTGTPLEKLSWNSPTLECHWRNLVESAPHWDATGETLTFAAYTGTPLEGLWQHTHAPTHIVEHAE